jgi:hypothetical protein
MLFGHWHMLGYTINGIGCRFRHVVDNDMEQQRPRPMERQHELHGIGTTGSGNSRLTFRHNFDGNTHLHVERRAKRHMVLSMGQRFNRQRD